MLTVFGKMASDCTSIFKMTCRRCRRDYYFQPLTNLNTGLWGRLLAPRCPSCED